MSTFTYGLAGNTHAAYLRNMINTNKSADEQAAYLSNVLAQSLTGSASDDASYVNMAAMFGFPNPAMAHSAYDELLSFFGKTSGNGSVSNVRVARDQAFARFVPNSPE